MSKSTYSVITSLTKRSPGLLKQNKSELEENLDGLELFEDHMR